MKIAATKTIQLTLKRDLAIAKEGYALLDQKRSFLALELMRLVSRAKELEKQLEAQRNQAQQALQQALATHGYQALERLAVRVADKHTVKVGLRVVGGTKVPQIEANIDSFRPHFSFAVTDSAIDDVAYNFHQLLQLNADLAGLQNHVVLLCREFVKTKRRVNALEHIFIPDFKRSLRSVNETLESKDLESFFVTKLIKNRLAEGERYG